jgi:hypothetical protein
MQNDASMMHREKNKTDDPQISQMTRIGRSFTCVIYEIS